MASTFEHIWNEYMEAVREHKAAHGEMMAREDQDTRRRYETALDTLRLTGERWRRAQALVEPNPR